MNRSLFLRYVRHARAVYPMRYDQQRAAFQSFASMYEGKFPSDWTPEQVADEQLWVEQVFAQEFPHLQPV